MNKFSRLSNLAAAITAGFALLAATGGALAQARSAQAPGFYAGGALGQSIVSDGCGGAAGAPCEDTSTAWRLLAGYQISRHFAVEGAYTRFGERDAGNGGVAATSRSTAWEIDGIAGQPLTPDFLFYGKLGLFSARTKMTAAGGSADATKSNLTFGIGGRYDLSRSLAARVEWQRYKSVGGDAVGTSDISVISVGAIYKF